MDDHNYILAVTLVAAAVTWALRALPFAVLAPLRDSKILPYLAESMPLGVMAILTVYTLRNVQIVEMTSIIPAAVGVIVTAVLHLWKANMLLSIVCGTTGYMLLAFVMAGAN